MREVDRLRQEAKRLRSNVNAKIGRIRRNYGVDVSGTKNDPRVDNSRIDRMNSAQLKSHLNKTRTFLDRNTGFVATAGKKGETISLRDWRAYKSVEARFNRMADKHKEQFADIIVPGSTMTVAQRDAEIKGKGKSNRRMVADASNRPLEAITREPGTVTSAKALKKLTRDLERRMNPTFYSKAMKAARSQAKTMLDGIGSPLLTDFVNSLTDEQFDLAWFYGKLADDLSARFDSDGENRALALDPGFETVKERAESDIFERDGWAEVFKKYGKG